jgi:Protein of unknown function (DUF1573)
MKKSLVVVCSLVLSLAAMSQKAVISFDKKIYDFGKINESDGKVTHIFEFTNNGTAPLVVNQAKPSCGCTTPNWTKEPVEPGKKGTITVTYNPSGRPGQFTKTITVTSNAENETEHLTITGEVIPASASNVNKYTQSIGELGFKAKGFSFGNVIKGNVATNSLDIKNNSKEPMTLTFTNVPQYITVKVVPETLKPNEEGKINFTFDSKLCKQWGPVKDVVGVVINGNKQKTTDNLINVMKFVIEDFSKLTPEQKRNAPILAPSTMKLNLGKLQEGVKKTGKITIVNSGRSTLEIRAISNSNKDLNVRMTQRSIPTGKSAELYLEVNTKDEKPNEYKNYFVVQTNDPENINANFEIDWTIAK